MLSCHEAFPCKPPTTERVQHDIESIDEQINSKENHRSQKDKEQDNSHAFLLPFEVRRIKLIHNAAHGQQPHTVDVFLHHGNVMRSPDGLSVSRCYKTIRPPRFSNVSEAGRANCLQIFHSLLLQEFDNSLLWYAEVEGVSACQLCEVHGTHISVTVNHWRAARTLQCWYAIQDSGAVGMLRHLARRHLHLYALLRIAEDKSGVETNHYQLLVNLQFFIAVGERNGEQER